jgi:hypothetical protein
MSYVIVSVLVLIALALLAQGRADVRRETLRRSRAFRYSDTGNVEYRSTTGGWMAVKSSKNSRPSHRYERIC